MRVSKVAKLKRIIYQIMLSSYFVIYKFLIEGSLGVI